ncbi:MAG: PilT/PilU family type 4a pilus ATPase [Victivallales bacterium]|nr:PilT/PilU family type 4a pilus ATPase [Victivallales bacterium]
MDLNTQWFIYALVDNQIIEIVDMEKCVALYEDLDTTSLEAYAQKILNLLTDTLSSEDAAELLEQFQAAMQFAMEQAKKGVSPSIFKGSMTEAVDQLPELDRIADMSDEEIADLVINMLTIVQEMGASDFHISAGSPPFIRHNLKIHKLSSTILSAQDSMRLNTIFLSEEQSKKFDEDMDLNCAQKISNSRFRVSLMMQKDGISGSYHIVPDEIRSLEQLGFLPNDVTTIERMLDYHNGLILVTGPLGSGKTTTLAAMMDILNAKRKDHIIAVEDPIEILHESKSCIVTQREVGKHTNSYSVALKGALREDPDIIVIGELHNLETIENAITASETGHLVIGTLHTCDAANTLNRLLDVFPPAQQQQIRTMTAGSLRGIVCQQLLTGVKDNLTVSYELLVGNLAVSNLIVEKMTHRLKGVMETGQKAGMCTFEANVLEKFKLGHISDETARAYVRDKAVKTELERAIAIQGAKNLAHGDE